jgi:hypothetical protein
LFLGRLDTAREIWREGVTEVLWVKRGFDERCALFHARNL